MLRNWNIETKVRWGHISRVKSVNNFKKNASWVLKFDTTFKPNLCHHILEISILCAQILFYLFFNFFCSRNWGLTNKQFVFMLNHQIIFHCFSKKNLQVINASSTCITYSSNIVSYISKTNSKILGETCTRGILHI